MGKTRFVAKDDTENLVLMLPHKWWCKEFVLFLGLLDIGLGRVEGDRKGRCQKDRYLESPMLHIIKTYITAKYYNTNIF